jgi:hypothetical protein
MLRSTTSLRLQHREHEPVIGGFVQEVQGNVECDRLSDVSIVDSPS